MSKNGEYNLELEEKISSAQLDIFDIKQQMMDMTDRVGWLERVAERQDNSHMIDKHFAFFLVFFMTIAFLLIKYL
jgi:hypothetical protein